MKNTIVIFLSRFREYSYSSLLKTNICVLMKNKIHKYDFLIVGAGPIGSIAALALVQKNESFNH